MRKSNVLIKYNGKNITKTLSAFMESFSWTDVASGSADTISVSLNNSSKMWFKKEYLPKKTDKIKAWLKVTDWKGTADNRSAFCGEFQVDGFTASGLPSVFSLEAICIPINKGFNVTPRNKTYKNTNSKRVLSDIAKRAGLVLYYDAPVHKIKEMSSEGKTDMEFGFSLCEEYNLAMKIYNRKLVIYDQNRYERKKASYNIDIFDLAESGAYSIEKNISQQYDGVKIQYTSGKDKKTVTYKYVLPGKAGNRLLFISGSADSHADAEKKAKAQLYKNLREVQVLTLSLKGDPKYKAAQCFNLTGFGALNGKYFIDEVTHNKDSKYTCTLKAHLVVTQIG